MSIWLFFLGYSVLGIINVISVILHDPDVAYNREKVIIFSSFLFFPLFIIFYVSMGVYYLIKLISPAVWFVLDKIAYFGKREDFGEDSEKSLLEEDDNIGNDIYTKSCCKSQCNPPCNKNCKCLPAKD